MKVSIISRLFLLSIQINYLLFNIFYRYQNYVTETINNSKKSQDKTEVLKINMSIFHYLIIERKYFSNIYYVNILKYSESKYVFDGNE